MNDQPLMQFASHIAGRNARVTIYGDRIEWTRNTLGAALGRSDTNMIPVRMIQGITTSKAGLAYTAVRVTTGGDVTEFRVSRKDAASVKDLLTNLMQQAHQQPVPVPNGHAPASLADELRKLGDLRAAGILDDAEFAAQKARLLA